MSEWTRSDDSAAKFLLPAAAGAFTGLRTATPVSVLAWTGRGFGPEWMKSPLVAGVLGAAAIGEWVVDKLPNTPSRLEPAGVVARAVAGAVCGAAMADAIGKERGPAAIAGGIGAVVGAALGYKARGALGGEGTVRRFAVAVAEDAVAIAGAAIIVGIVTRMATKR